MSKLLIHEPPLQVLPSLAEAIGLNEAIVIQQLHYWLQLPKGGKEQEGHKWIFNTYEEWAEQFPFWSVSTIQRTFASLEKSNLIISKQLNKKGHDMTKFYRINYDELCKMEDVKMESSKTPNRHDVNKNTENTEEPEKIKEVAQAPKPLKANQIPQVILFREVTTKYPSKGSQFTVITSVDKAGDRLGREAIADDLLPFYREWCDRGYNPMAVKWLEWAVSGEIPQRTNGNRLTQDKDAILLEVARG